MRLNPVNGKAALGDFDEISVDGVVPAPLVGVGAVKPRWMDAAGNVLIYHNGTPSRLDSIDLDTMTVSTVTTGGANVLAAGSSLYVASLNTGALSGVRSNIPGWTLVPTAGLGDMDENGDFAIIQAFAADRGVSLYTSGGALVQTIDIPIAPSAVIRCKTGLCAFSGANSAWQLRDLTDGSLVSFADRTTGVIETVPILMASGEIWVIERTGTDTLTARRATDNQGYVISSTIVYNPDVMELSPGVLRIGWSATPGEGPTALRLADLTVGTGAQTLWSTSTGSLVSSAGPTLPVSALPATLTGQGLMTSILNDGPFTYPQGAARPGYLTDEFGVPFLLKLLSTLKQPINLQTQTTGVLPEESGGTGGGTGTSIINASNVTLGTLPQNVKWTQYDTSATGSQDDFTFSIGGTQADVIRADNASTLTLTGLAAGVQGQHLVVAATVGDIVLSQEDGSSDAENRIETFSGLDVTISVDEAAYLVYDGTSERWRLLFVSAASVSPATAGFWSPLTAGPPLVLEEVVQNAGTWSLLTNGDPVTPELMWDSNGDVISTWLPSGIETTIPGIVADSDGATIATWNPTP